MGNFLSFLGGFSKGATSRYKALDDEKRKRKQDLDDLVSQTLIDRASKDDTLTPDGQLDIWSEGMRRRGMDEKTIESLRGASGIMRDVFAKQEEAAKAAGPKILPDGIAAPQLPPVPQGPAPTIGDIKADKAHKRHIDQMTQEANVKTDLELAADKKKREDAIAFLKANGVTPTEEQIAKLAGAQNPLTPPINIPGRISGSQLLEQGITSIDGPNGPVPVKPEEFYTQAQNRAGAIVRTTPAANLPTTRGNVVRLPTGEWVQQILDGATKKVVSYVPAEAPTSTLGVQTAGQHDEITDDGQGHKIAVPVYSRSTRAPVLGPVPGTGPTFQGGESTANGVPAGTLPPVPQAGGQTSPIQNQGNVTVPTASGKAPAAKPGPPSAPRTGIQTGGVPGRIVGAKNPQFNEGEVEHITNQVKMLDDMNSMGQALPVMKNLLGPISGKMTDMRWDILDNDEKTGKNTFGLTPQQKQFIFKMRDFVATKAFEEAGKTVPPGEQKLYLAHLPNLNMSPGTMFEAIQIDTDIAKRAFNIRMGLLAPEKKNYLRSMGWQIPDGMPGVPGMGPQYGGSGAQQIAPVPQGPDPRIGKTATTKDGTKVVVDSINPDGTAHVTPVQGGK